jgi:hypothetical protein
MENLTIITIAALLVTEVVKESGKSIAKGTVTGFEKILEVLREKFKSADSDEVLQQLKAQPTDRNIGKFKEEFTAFLHEDRVFVRKLAKLIEQLQIDLSNLYETNGYSESLEEVIKKAEASDWISSTESDFTEWLKDVKDLISIISPTDKLALEAITFTPPAISNVVPDCVMEGAFRNGLQSVISLLKSLREKLIENTRISSQYTGNVWIVHGQVGRGQNIKSTVYQFINHLHLPTVFLDIGQNFEHSISIDSQRKNDVIHAIVIFDSDLDQSLVNEKN